MVIDDEPLIRAGLKHVFDTVPDITTTGAVPVSDAAAALAEQEAHVVFLDCCPEDAPAVSAALDRFPVRPAVCVLSRYKGGDLAAFALGSGARGYVRKDTDPDRFPPLVRFLAQGWTMLSSETSHLVVDGFLHHTARALEPDHTTRLTPRERTVLVLMAAGLSNTDIGMRLHLAPSTVKDHVSVIFTKLEVTGRVQAALCADRAGLLPGP
ncbi:response regulator transcription factor [Streptomyces sp. NBC_01298]|uniref:response regulator transcription factor n=1 Tax=Streptomyces sp. NBC_01298 TaxID=2903817 RepID=UPI002E0DEE78|nr:response regulator transcription factor [Streptomyces sp. NBC_01298]